MQISCETKLVLLKKKSNSRTLGNKVMSIVTQRLMSGYPKISSFGGLPFTLIAIKMAHSQFSNEDSLQAGHLWPPPFPNPVSSSRLYSLWVLLFMPFPLFSMQPCQCKRLSLHPKVWEWDDSIEKNKNTTKIWILNTMVLRLFWSFLITEK